MGESWIVSNLNAALSTWNDKLSLIHILSDAYFQRSAERLKTALESEVNQN